MVRQSRSCGGALWCVLGDPVVGRGTGTARRTPRCRCEPSAVARSWDAVPPADLITCRPPSRWTRSRRGLPLDAQPPCGPDIARIRPWRRLLGAGEPRANVGPRCWSPHDPDPARLGAPRGPYPSRSQISSRSQSPRGQSPTAGSLRGPRLSRPQNPSRPQRPSRSQIPAAGSPRRSCLCRSQIPCRSEVTSWPEFHPMAGSLQVRVARPVQVRFRAGSGAAGGLWGRSGSASGAGRLPGGGLSARLGCRTAAG
jgi:hypothetical protein